MSDVAAIKELGIKYKQLKSEISKVIVGQHETVDHVLYSIFAGGHSLLIGVPGLAKTLLVHTIAKAIGLDFKRIQDILMRPFFNSILWKYRILCKYQ